jgi:hypothetical protein
MVSAMPSSADRISTTPIGGRAPSGHGEAVETRAAPSCGRLTWPHAGPVVSWLHGTATLCVPCLRAQAGYGYIDQKWGRK